MANDVETLDVGGWKIARHPVDGQWMLTHPKYEAFTNIVTFDEACRLRDAIRTGRFIAFVRGYEAFYEALQKKMKS